MKKLVYSFAAIAAIISFSFVARAQQGYISTLGGCQNCAPNLTDGVPATQYSMGWPAGIWLDGQNNIYVAERHGNVVRKIVNGLIYTVAGNGIGGFSGDGGAATSAKLSQPTGICMDAAANLYIADAQNSRIRKVDAVTGIITTIAGGGVDVSDGIAALSAAISPQCVYVDGAGNIYTGSNNKVRKIDALTGIITTVAGNGNSVEAGDGGQAMNASFNGDPVCITEDIAGNMYVISDNGGRVRKINAITGVITTVAGGGNLLADGVAATSTDLSYLTGCALDAAGNIYVADRSHSKVRKVDVLTGLINTIAGNGNVMPNNVPALTSLSTPDMMYVDHGGTVYYTGGVLTFADSFLFKIAGPPYYPMDSFSASIISNCGSTTVAINTNSYAPGMHIKVYWGDNPIPDDSAILSGIYGGYATASHAYTSTGSYTIKLELYNGATMIDSTHITYSSMFCATTCAQFYLDMNNNCVKDSAEVLIHYPSLVEVDSNNVIVDTLSVTSGFYYTAYGNPGDVYQFKIIDEPNGMLVACPVNGIITTTLQAANIVPVNSIGYHCAAINDFDLAVDAVRPRTGLNGQWTRGFAGNNMCMPTGTTVTVNFSPKYVYNYAVPAPTSVNGNSITWDLGSLSANDPGPVSFYYKLLPAGPLTLGDTVQTHINVTPTAGDVDLSNNTIIFHDTIKASCDPNLIEVTPEGVIAAGTELKYRIEFENVGNDTAFNIYVLDTLPNELEANSMRIVSSTHTMFVSPYQAAGYNIVWFDFPDIDLLDSTHHEDCTGAFTYTIKSKTGLAPGTLIDHRAGIYFDDNGLVLTNTVENVIGAPINVKELSKGDKIELYPNPASDELTISTGKNIYGSVTITNSMGQVVMQQVMKGAETKLNVKALPAGMYYVNMVGDKGSVVRKFVRR